MALFIFILLTAGGEKVFAETAEIRRAALNPRFSRNLIDMYKRELITKESEINITGNVIPSPVQIEKNGIVVKRDISLPSRYDLRDYGKMSGVKDQGYINGCWTFGAYASLESNMLMQGLGLYDFSENNMLTHHGFDLGVDDGGNINMSSAYLARWEGPILEEKDPYPTIMNPENVIVRNGLKADKHLQEIIYIPKRLNYLDNDDIKKAVMQYGAVDSSINYNNSYYNYFTNGFYSTDLYGYANHEIDIVGWDDGYSANNFLVKPPGNGAFIVKNSWGSSWGEKGYFYVSYYDPIIGDENAVYNGVESANNYNGIYQYDTLGMTSTFGYDSGTAWFSNVFTAKNSAELNEKLTAVSFYTTKKNAQYEVYFKDNFAADDFSNMIKVKSGTIAMPGYHTIKLDSPVSLTSGKRFAVAVKLYVPGEIYPIAVEYPMAGYSGLASANWGESFVSDNGTDWEDLQYSSYNTNVCLKAFTSANLKGDINNDFKIDNGDISLISQRYNVYKTNGTYEDKYDLNGDGVIDIYDMVFAAKEIK